MGGIALKPVNHHLRGAQEMKAGGGGGVRGGGGGEKKKKPRA